MGENTKIEWADHTFNPWVGCEKISPACAHCYAATWANRAGNPELWEGQRRRTTAENWKLPLKWNKAARAAGVRARVFCASLADVFDNAVPAEWRFDLFSLIAFTPHLDWLLLTKRIGNARSMMDDIAVRVMHRPRGEWAPMPNVWLGATIANQEEADRDIPKLLATPARIRFLSIEPMLGPVDVSPWLSYGARGVGMGGFKCSGEYRFPAHVDWVICGGESGPGARPMYLRWVQALRDQCAAVGVPFLFKQWGEWIPAGQPYLAAPQHPPVREFGYDEEGHHRLHRIGKHAAGRLLDGIEHNGFPA